MGEHNAAKRAALERGDAGGGGGGGGGDAVGSDVNIGVRPLQAYRRLKRAYERWQTVYGGEYDAEGRRVHKPRKLLPADLAVAHGGAAAGQARVCAPSAWVRGKAQRVIGRRRLARHAPPRVRKKLRALMQRSTTGSIKWLKKGYNGRRERAMLKFGVREWMKWTAATVRRSLRILPRQAAKLAATMLK